MNDQIANPDAMARFAAPLGSAFRSYHQEASVTIYHGDCREIVPTLSGFDLVLTDPPYPNYMEKEYGYHDGIIDWLAEIKCRQLIFWTPSARFPLDWSGMRVWDKAVGTCTQFELIYERNYGSGYKVHRYMTPHNRVRAQICRDVCNEHPSQKPIQLLTRLIGETEAQVILDPYAGSGTTGLAAKNLNKRAILIEREERYCEIAARRLAQEVLPLGTPNHY
jgi:site-specific DNA-methyltransferase (adenine-specific)